MKRLLSLLLAISAPLFAADPVEADYYKITTFQTPKETALEEDKAKLASGSREEFEVKQAMLVEQAKLTQLEAEINAEKDHDEGDEE